MLNRARLLVAVGILLILVAVEALIAYRIGWSRGEVYGAAEALAPSVAYIREHCPPVGIGTSETDPIVRDL